ncbi:hypothetical protein [Novosphingobium sp. Gsoil 351]|uniref:DUF6894 family protein n=1 Tax=Novosphingobium sp. Gsoil 351 TaxID=2675225 RepID=UPI0012B48828|nr:hypothetical protein [Novosphingobium sp. Gsoil 351]QGN54634.1 hypothetical protein GKE62_08770 [Novosphingobium sp. Gsoil 351]
MPLFYFHIDGEGLDANGCEYDDLATAKCAAVKMAGEILCDESDHFWDRMEWRMTVTDESDLSLFSLTFFATEAASINYTR